MPKLSQLSNLLRWFGLPAALIAASIIISKAASVVQIPLRVERLEATTVSLVAGQEKLNGRLDSLAGEISGMRRESTSDAERSSRAAQTILGELAKINGNIATLTENSIKAQADVSALREKTINAQIKMDDIESKMFDHLVNGKQTKADKKTQTQP